MQLCSSFDIVSMTFDCLEFQLIFLFDVDNSYEFELCVSNKTKIKNVTLLKDWRRLFEK